jgi:hypothetical protein
MESTKTRAQAFAELANPPQRRYRREPATWAVERGGLELWSAQREIMESVRDNRLTAVHSCHQIGKSFIASAVVCWFLDTYPAGEARVVTTAPTAPQVKAILWHEINQLHKNAGLPGRLNMTEWYLGNQLVAFGRKPSDYSDSAFQGVHARYFLVVLDEACGIPTSLWTAASTLAANEHSRILAIGNPDNPVGEFADNCRPDGDWNVIGVGYEDTPNFTGEEVSGRLKEMLISKVWVDDRRRKWGEDSALFQSKCRGVFPTVGDPWQVVPKAWAERCRWLDHAPQPTADVEAGVDVAAGNDRLVVTIRQGTRVLAVEYFVESDPEKAVGRVALFLREWNVRRAKVDAIGVGWGVYGALRSSSSHHHPDLAAMTHATEVIPINVSNSASPSQQHLYMNRRAELWFLGRDLSKDMGWDFAGLPSDVVDDLIHELTLPRYEIVDASGRVKVESKDKIRDRLKASPDLAESCLLAFAPANWTAESSPDALLRAPSLLQGQFGQPLSVGPAGLGRRGW